LLSPVTITASRRREPAREVPIQVNVLPAQQLERSGAKSLSDYLADQPGVDVKTTGGAGLGSITVRGVSTGTQTIPTVSTYIDDVAFGSSSAYLLGTTTALDMALLDLNHVELLRGPQGTLYGASSMGGLLKYVTNEPDSSALTGKVSFGGSTTRQGKPGYTASGVVNVPLKEDVAALRVAVFRDHAGGYVDAVGPAAGRDINRGDTTGARVSLQIEPSSRSKIRLTATSQEIEREGVDYVDYDPATGKPVEGDLQRRLSVREPYKVKIDVAAAEIEYDFGWARLNSITSGQRSHLTQRYDYSVYAPFGPVFLPAPGTLDAVTLDLQSRVDKVTQEFRLTSRAGGTFEWLAGAFYTHEKGVNPQRLSTTIPGGAAGPDLLEANLPSKYVETAVYGDVTWNVTPRLALTGGVRVARNEQDYTQQNAGPLVGGTPDPITAHSAETADTYLATARYALDRTSNVYLRAASGYRPGGPNPIVGGGASQTFEHDSLWSYEAGYKADLLDRALSIEAAVFEIDWKNIQQFSAVNGINIIANGGDAKVRGAELAATYRPDSAWRLNGSVAYTDAHLSGDSAGLAPSGARLPNTARLSATVGADYLFALAGSSAYVGFTHRHVGQRNAGFEGNSAFPNYILPSYSLTDLRAGVDFARFQVALYVRNAFDNRAQINAATDFVPLGGTVRVSPAPPRTIGLTVSATF
jgi:outer membrane receptor protein involved in Fe transport